MRPKDACRNYFEMEAKLKKSTKSGYDFQIDVENKLLTCGLFGNTIERVLNIYSYTELVNSSVVDINDFLRSAEEDVFLIKNYPLFNVLDEDIEYCIKSRFDDVTSDCYVECKFYDVRGTAYQKLYHYFAEHSLTHMDNMNSFMIEVYDGLDFYNDTKTRQHVKNIKENYIRYNYRQMILSIEDFEMQFLPRLEMTRDMASIFRVMKDIGY